MKYDVCSVEIQRQNDSKTHVVDAADGDGDNNTLPTAGRL